MRDRRKIQFDSERCLTNHCQHLCDVYKRRILQMYDDGFYGNLKHHHLNPSPTATNMCTCNEENENAVNPINENAEAPPINESAEAIDIGGAAALVMVDGVEENLPIDPDPDLDLLMDVGEDLEDLEEEDDEILILENFNVEVNVSKTEGYLRRKEAYARNKINTFKRANKTRLDKSLTLMHLNRHNLTLENLKLSRHKLSLEFHPDKWPIKSANEMQSCINEAHYYLKHYLTPLQVDLE